MSRTANVPDALRHGPFHVEQAYAEGVDHDRLRGRSYRRLFPRVWVLREHQMSEADWHRAALLYAPNDACFTGVTRLQQLGLDVGPHRPMQMVVGRDLHRDRDDDRREVYLHRCDVLPEHRDRSVSVTAAFVEACRTLTVLDAVAAGDWLLRAGMLEPERFLHFCRRDHWRAGVEEALWLWPMLDGRSWSLQESRARVFFLAAGLPRPELNVPIEQEGRTVAIVDWWWRSFRAAAEYEGGHHQTDRGQYVADIDRFAALRRADVAYTQITREHFRSPRAMVRAIHSMLVASGYIGPEPAFGAAFRAVELPVAEARLLASRLPGSTISLA